MHNAMQQEDFLTRPEPEYKTILANTTRIDMLEQIANSINSGLQLLASDASKTIENK